MAHLLNKFSPRRIVMFLPREAYTGGERYLLEIRQYLERQGAFVEPMYLEHSVEGRRGFSLTIDCLLANFRFFRQTKHLGDLTNVVFFEDFHLHPRLWLFNELVRLKTGKLKTVVLMQSAPFYHSALNHSLTKRLDEFVVRVFLRQSSLVLTNSAFTRQEVLSFSIDPKRVKAIYCGYDRELTLEPLEMQKIGKCSEPKRILFVGQCVEVKGIEFLIRSLPMLPDRQIILDVVGNTNADPNYFNRLRDIVDRLELQNRVIFHGHVSDRTVLANFYKRADVFVLPSLMEGFGIVLLDAMSFGLPIVATRVGAIPELVKDGSNGLLVSPAAPTALSEAIERLFNFPKLRRQYGQTGHKFILEHRGFYRWEALGQRAFQAMKPMLEYSP